MNTCAPRASESGRDVRGADEDSSAKSSISKTSLAPNASEEASGIYWVSRRKNVVLNTLHKGWNPKDDKNESQHISHSLPKTSLLKNNKKNGLCLIIIFETHYLESFFMN